MDFDEIAFIVAIEGRSGCAMGFITNDQIKISQVVIVLRLMDDFDGVIGTEHHAHVLDVMALGHFRR